MWKPKHIWFRFFFINLQNLKCIHWLVITFTGILQLFNRPLNSNQRNKKLTLFMLQIEISQLIIQIFDFQNKNQILFKIFIVPIPTCVVKSVPFYTYSGYSILISLANQLISLVDQLISTDLYYGLGIPQWRLECQMLPSHPPLSLPLTEKETTQESHPSFCHWLMALQLYSGFWGFDYCNGISTCKERVSVGPNHKVNHSPYKLKIFKMDFGKESLSLFCYQNILIFKEGFFFFKVHILKQLPLNYI